MTECKTLPTVDARSTAQHYRPERLTAATSERRGEAERVAVASLGRKGQLTIPADVRKAAGLQPGQVLSIEVTDQGILVRPIEIDPDQAWFWTPEWQAKEREADEDIAAGRLRVFHSTDEFLAALGEE
jgi:AbrB family looped-hinge helix DNA binding protein